MEKLEKIGWIFLISVAVMMVLLIFFSNILEADVESIEKESYDLVKMALLFSSGLMFGFFLILYSKLCVVLEKMKKLEESLE